MTKEKKIYKNIVDLEKETDLIYRFITKAYDLKMISIEQAIALNGLNCKIKTEEMINQTDGS